MKEMGNSKDAFIQEFIKTPGRYYLSQLSPRLDSQKPFMEKDVCFFHIKSITFEEKAPKKEAVENVLSMMRLPFINFIYLIKGDERKVSFYMGISRDIVQYVQGATDLVNLDSYGGSLLKRGVQGNFRGSVIEEVKGMEKKELIQEITSYGQMGILEGVPGLNKDDSEDFQRVERLIDVMLGDKFMFLVTAKYIPFDGITGIEHKICTLFDKIAPLGKINLQKGSSSGESKTSTSGTSTQKQMGKSVSKSESSSGTNGGSEGQKTYSKSQQTSTTTTENTSNSSGESTSVAEGFNKSQSSTTSTEYVNIEYQNWQKYIENTLLPRIDYGKGMGMFNVAISLYAQNELTLYKLANTATALFSGEKGNIVPLLLHKLDVNSEVAHSIKNFQIPLIRFKNKITENEVLARTAYSQTVSEAKAFLSNWYSVKELGVIAGLPRKEVVGLALNEEVEFGLNIEETPREKIHLGHLVQSGQKTNIAVSLNRKELSRHIFICGVTGSGKTTTCLSILKESGLPFLVIEPVKTEYRVLANSFPDLLVFTLGDEKVAPFRLNPLEFLPSESIASHVDMLKASLEAAFDMEAAIPQIIEEALYQCYENFGWNIRTNRNEHFDNPFAPGVYSFPTFSDFIKATETVIDNHGFDDRLKNDYKGSLTARLKVLTLGTKGQMLDVPRSVNIKSLLNKKVVIELDNIKSGSEKSLIMGFILSYLNEAIKDSYSDNKNYCHITIVEEAHRLLSKYQPGDSLNKKNGVEVFADMLAEIRKYGESLIIADQIPNKMTPEVLKNTNTKIVHKIFAQDDKDAIGNTMSLSDSQKSFLSNLSVGRAVVSSQSWSKSIQVQVLQTVDTTNDDISPEKLREIVLEFYSDTYKEGAIPELVCLRSHPSASKVEMILENIELFYKLRKTFYDFIITPKTPKNFQKNLLLFKEVFINMKNILEPLEMVDYLLSTMFVVGDEDTRNVLFDFVKDLHHGNLTIDSFMDEKYSLLINSQNNFKKV